MSADPSTKGQDPYVNKLPERAGSSTRSIFHFTGHAPRLESEDEQSSAGHTPFMNGTPRSQSRTELATPMLTPAKEVENMSWDTQATPPQMPPRSVKAPPGLQKKTSLGELYDRHASHKNASRRRPSICGECKQESEAIARMEAEKMAAEVEAHQPKPASLTPSQSSSEKSSKGSTGKKIKSILTPSKAADKDTSAVHKVAGPDSVQEHLVMADSATPVMDEEPTVAEMAEQYRLRRAATTIHAMNARRDFHKRGKSAASTAMQPYKAHETAVPVASRFQEDIPATTQSTPAPPTSPAHLVEASNVHALTRTAANPAAATHQCILSPENSALENDASQETHEQTHPRPRWRPVAKVRSVWMALLKPKLKRDKMNW